MVVCVNGAWITRTIRYWYDPSLRAASSVTHGYAPPHRTALVGQIPTKTLQSMDQSIDRPLNSFNYNVSYPKSVESWIDSDFFRAIQTPPRQASTCPFAKTKRSPFFNSQPAGQRPAIAASNEDPPRLPTTSATPAPACPRGRSRPGRPCRPVTAPPPPVFGGVCILIPAAVVGQQGGYWRR